MHWRSVILSSVLAAVFLTAACRGTTPTSPSSPVLLPPQSPTSSASCDVTKAQWAIGEPASDELLERARVAAGASSTRLIRPNQPITLEYRGSRLNLWLDARDIVTAVLCG